MIPDPPRRKDGTCYVCRKPLRRVVPQRGVPHELYDREPFCSSRCAREFFGQSLPPTGYRDPDEEAI